MMRKVILDRDATIVDLRYGLGTVDAMNTPVAAPALSSWTMQNTGGRVVYIGIGASSAAVDAWQEVSPGRSVRVTVPSDDATSVYARAPGGSVLTGAPWPGFLELLPQ